MEDKCEYSENGKCMHFCSEGELDCKGTEKEMNNCMVYVEVSH